LNAERLQVLPGRSTLWSKQEDEALLRLATELAPSCRIRRALYARLGGHFSNRSEEAIRKRLQLLRWSPDGALGARLLREGEQSPTQAILSESIVDDERESALWVGAMQSAIVDSLASVEDEELNTARLCQLVRDWREGLLDLRSVQLVFEQLTAETFPHVWRPSTFKYRAGAAVKTKRQIRRAQFAQVQKLYATRRKDCADTVLSGDWRAAHESSLRRPTSLGEFWSQVFDQPSMPDPRPVEAGPPKWSVLVPIAAHEVTEALKQMGQTAPGLDRVTTADLLRKNQEGLAQFLNT
uniref:RNA-dependent RNA polymerase n=1 Tax=Echinostoma caproni TaxID=27848 RepID=A0A183BGL9_9TREM